MTGMRRVATVLSLILAAVALAGCASPQRQVRSDYDPNADFGRYRTFNFMPGAGRSPTGGDYSTLVAQRIEAAVEREMSSRGYVRAENPDLLVNFQVTVKNVTKWSGLHL